MSFIVINVSKEAILNKDLSHIDFILNNNLEAKPFDYFQSVQILFDGFDHDSREIFEIPAIREWTLHLLTNRPEIIFYIDNQFAGLQNIMLCVSNVQKIVQSGNEVLLEVQVPTKLHMFLLESIQKSIRPEVHRNIVFNDLLKYQIG